MILFALIIPVICLSAAKLQKIERNTKGTRFFFLPKRSNFAPQRTAKYTHHWIVCLERLDTTNPVYDPADEEFRRRMQKKGRQRVGWLVPLPN